MLRQTAIVCLAFAACISARPTGDTQAALDKCFPSECSPLTNPKFAYEAGKQYEHHYETQVTTTVDGKTATVQYRGNVALSFDRPCEVTMWVDRPIDPNFQHDSANDQFLPEAFHTAMAKPIVFSYVDGKIEHVCPVESDERFSINMKKAIISAFAHEPESFVHSGNELETTLNGECKTHYENNAGYWSDDVSYKKTTALQSCIRSKSGLFSNHGTPYRSPTGPQNAPISVGKHSCKVDMKGSRINDIICEEDQTVKPHPQSPSFETKSYQKLRYHSSGPAERSRPTINSRLSESIEYVHDQKLLAPSKDISKQVEILACSSTWRPTTDSEKVDIFIDIVTAMKSMSSSELRSIFSSEMLSSENCQDRNEIITTALSMAGTSESSSLLIEMLINPTSELSMPNHNLDISQVLSGLSMSEPVTEELLVYVNEALDSGKLSVPKSDIWMPIGAMINSHCKKYECKRTEAVEKLVQKMLSEIESCHSINPAESTPKREAVISALLGLSNAGKALDRIPETLSNCFKSNSMPEHMDMQILAIQATRFMPNKDQNEELWELFELPTENDEVRIEAYRALISDADETTIRRVIDALEQITSDQVGSYVYSHLMSLRKRSSPVRRHIFDLITSLPPQFKNRSPMTYSTFERMSTFSSAWNVGADFDLSVIHDHENSVVPKSASASLTTNIFGKSVNLLEVGIRTDGLQKIVDQLLMTYNRGEETSEKYISSDSSPNYLTKVSAYVRMFGNNVRYSELLPEDLTEQGLLSRARSMVNSAYPSTVMPSYSMLLDTTVMIPSVSGFPLVVRGQAASKTMLEFNWAVTESGRKLELIVKPRAAVELRTEISIPTHHGLKMGVTGKTSITTATELNVNAESRTESNGNRNTRFEWNISPEQDIFTFKHELSHVVGNVVEPVREPYSPHRKCFQSETIGMAVCMETSKSNPGYYTYFKTLSVDTIDQDMRQAYIEVISPTNRNGNKIEITFDTPNTEINRKFHLELSRHAHSYLMVVETPIPSVESIVWKASKESDKLASSLKVNDFSVYNILLARPSTDSERYTVAASVGEGDSKMFGVNANFRKSDGADVRSVEGTISEYYHKPCRTCEPIEISSPITVTGELRQSRDGSKVRRMLSIASTGGYECSMSVDTKMGPGQVEISSDLHVPEYVTSSSSFEYKWIPSEYKLEMKHKDSWYESMEQPRMHVLIEAEMKENRVELESKLSVLNMKYVAETTVSRTSNGFGLSGKLGIDNRNIAVESSISRHGSVEDLSQADLSGDIRITENKGLESGEKTILNGKASVSMIKKNRGGKIIIDLESEGEYIPSNKVDFTIESSRDETRSNRYHVALNVYQDSRTVISTEFLAEVGESSGSYRTSASRHGNVIFSSEASHRATGNGFKFTSMHETPFTSDSPVFFNLEKTSMDRSHSIFGKFGKTSKDYTVDFNLDSMTFADTTVRRTVSVEIKSDSYYPRMDVMFGSLSTKLSGVPAVSMEATHKRIQGNEKIYNSFFGELSSTPIGGMRITVGTNIANRSALDFSLEISDGVTYDMKFSKKNGRDEVEYSHIVSGVARAEHKPTSSPIPNIMLELGGSYIYEPESGESVSKDYRVIFGKDFSEGTRRISAGIELGETGAVLSLAGSYVPTSDYSESEKEGKVAYEIEIRVPKTEVMDFERFLYRAGGSVRSSNDGENSSHEALMTTTIQLNDYKIQSVDTYSARLNYYKGDGFSYKTEITSPFLADTLMVSLDASRFRKHGRSEIALDTHYNGMKPVFFSFTAAEDIPKVHSIRQLYNEDFSVAASGELTVASIFTARLQSAEIVKKGRSLEATISTSVNGKSYVVSTVLSKEDTFRVKAVVVVKDVINSMDIIVHPTLVKLGLVVMDQPFDLSATYTVNEHQTHVEIKAEPLLYSKIMIDSRENRLAMKSILNLQWYHTSYGPVGQYEVTLSAMAPEHLKMTSVWDKPLSVKCDVRQIFKGEKDSNEVLISFETIVAKENQDLSKLTIDTEIKPMRSSSTKMSYRHEMLASGLDVEFAVTRPRGGDRPIIKITGNGSLENGKLTVGLTCDMPAWSIDNKEAKLELDVAGLSDSEAAIKLTWSEDNMVKLVFRLTPTDGKLSAEVTGPARSYLGIFNGEVSFKFLESKGLEISMNSECRNMDFLAAAEYSAGNRLEMSLTMDVSPVSSRPSLCDEVSPRLTRYLDSLPMSSGIRIVVSPFPHSLNPKVILSSFTGSFEHSIHMTADDKSTSIGIQRVAGEDLTMWIKTPATTHEVIIELNLNPSEYSVSPKISYKVDSSIKYSVGLELIRSAEWRKASAKLTVKGPIEGEMYTDYNMESESKTMIFKIEAAGVTACQVAIELAPRKRSAITISTVSNYFKNMKVISDMTRSRRVLKFECQSSLFSYLWNSEEDLPDLRTELNWTPSDDGFEMEFTTEINSDKVLELVLEGKRRDETQQLEIELNMTPFWETDSSNKFKRSLNADVSPNNVELEIYSSSKPVVQISISRDVNEAKLSLIVDEMIKVEKIDIELVAKLSPKHMSAEIKKCQITLVPGRVEIDLTYNLEYNCNLDPSEMGESSRRNILSGEIKSNLDYKHSIGSNDYNIKKSINLKLDETERHLYQMRSTYGHVSDSLGSANMELLGTLDVRGPYVVKLGGVDGCGVELTCDTSRHVYTAHIISEALNERERIGITMDASEGKIILDTFSIESTYEMTSSGHGVTISYSDKPDSSSGLRPKHVQLEWSNGSEERFVELSSATDENLYWKMTIRTPSYSRFSIESECKVASGETMLYKLEKRSTSTECTYTLTGPKDSATFVYHHGEKKGYQLTMPNGEVFEATTKTMPLDRMAVLSVKFPGHSLKYEVMTSDVENGKELKIARSWNSMRSDMTITVKPSEPSLDIEIRPDVSGDPEFVIVAHVHYIDSSEIKAEVAMRNSENRSANRRTIYLRQLDSYVVQYLYKINSGELNGDVYQKAFDQYMSYERTNLENFANAISTVPKELIVGCGYWSPSETVGPASLLWNDVDEYWTVELAAIKDASMKMVNDNHMYLSKISKVLNGFDNTNFRSILHDTIVAGFVSLKSAEGKIEYYTKMAEYSRSTMDYVSEKINIVKRMVPRPRSSLLESINSNKYYSYAREVEQKLSSYTGFPSLMDFLASYVDNSYSTLISHLDGKIESETLQEGENTIVKKIITLPFPLKTLRIAPNVQSFRRSLKARFGYLRSRVTDLSQKLKSGHPWSILSDYYADSARDFSGSLIHLVNSHTLRLPSAYLPAISPRSVTSSTSYVYGGEYYTTFDGYSAEMVGCSSEQELLLVHDEITHLFTVKMRRGASSPSSPPSRWSVELIEGTSRATINIERPSDSRRPSSARFEVSPSSSISTSRRGDVLVMRGSGVVVRCSEKLNNCKITVSNLYRNNLKGLLGHEFNREQFDDSLVREDLEEICLQGCRCPLAIKPLALVFGVSESSIPSVNRKCAEFFSENAEVQKGSSVVPYAPFERMCSNEMTKNSSWDLAVCRSVRAYSSIVRDSGVNIRAPRYCSRIH